jgi:fatty-acyl-CoA synthase
MDLLIGSIVGAVNRGQRDLAAATLGDETISFGDLDLGANRLAHALRGAGVERGSVVAWWSGPALHNLAGMLACARLGAVFAPISPLVGERDAREVLAYIEPRLLVCDRSVLEAGSSFGIAAVASIGPCYAPSPHDLESACGSSSSAPVRTPALSDADPHILYLTSGSTGRSKGVLVSHRASWLRSRAGGGSYGDDLRGVVCSFPLYHYGGWHYVLEAWLNGTTVHLVRRADGPELISIVERHRPNAMYCIPAVWERVLAEPGDLGSIRYADTGTSTVTGELIGAIGRRMPQARTTILYGATESGRMSALADPQADVAPGAVGRAVPPGRIELADDGEVLFSGPTLMDGYLRLPEETAAAVENGWYRTGDIGRRDEDGLIYLTGRKREVIRSGGETVSPVEVEVALGSLPGVRELAVVGVPDPRWGEIICAAVVVIDGCEAPTVNDLRERLGALSSYKHPRLVAPITGIPRTSATGQVMRGRLRDMVLAQLRRAGVNASG